MKARWVGVFVGGATVGLLAVAAAGWVGRDDPHQSLASPAPTGATGSVIKSITVTGQGSIKVKPDTASLDELRQAAEILNHAGSRILATAFNQMTSIPRSAISRENRPVLQYRLARNHISQSRIEPAQRRKAQDYEFVKTDEPAKRAKA